MTTIPKCPRHNTILLSGRACPECETATIKRLRETDASIETVHFTQDQIDLAHQMDVEVRASHKKKGKKQYTGLERPERYFLGFLGEIGFETLLQKHNIRYEIERRTDGVVDQFDYQVYLRGSPKSLNVKTAPEPHHVLCAMPEIQWKIHGRHTDVVVGARLESRRQGTYHGWSTAKEVNAWHCGYLKKDHPLTRSARLDSMRRLPNLYDQLDKNAPAN